MINRGNYDLDSVKKAILRAGTHYGRKTYDLPPSESEFFDGFAMAGMGPHYARILDLISRPNPDILWGISDENFPGGLDEFRMSISKSVIRVLGPQQCFDGGIWKKAFMSGEIIELLREIRKYHVVVIGMDHLKNINKHLMMPNFNFIKVSMPLASYLDEFRGQLETFHKSIQSPVVYMCQMSIDGIPIICESELPESYVLDIGRGLDVWAEPNLRPSPQHWLDGIPKHLIGLYYLNGKWRYPTFL